MREQTLRCVLLVKAIEEVDHAATILPLGDRERATREASRAAGLAPPPDTSGRDDARIARALGERAERLVRPLEERHPIVAEVLGRTRTPRWILVALLLLALASGVVLSALDGSRHINILAFPFLGLIAWNLAAYVLLALAWLRRRRRAARSPRPGERWAAAAYTQRIAPLLKQTKRVDSVLGGAIGEYSAGWVRHGAPFIGQHLRRGLHLAAAAVALGLIVGLYLRGTLLRYEAGWESTFLGPGQVRSLLGLLFGPVAGWSGITLPRTVEEVEALRWTATGGGGDAAPWIHLIALSLAAYVLLPRLLLAGVATLALVRLGHFAALPDELRRYASRVLYGGAARAVGTASVTPYAYDPSDAAMDGLARWLATVAGDGVQIERRTTLRYGEEDMAGPAFAIGAHRSADLHVVLLSLAATPEAENHGLVITAARDAAHGARPPAAVRIVVDESPYAQRLAGDASLAPRLEERRRLWRDFVAGFGLSADLVAL